MGLWQKFKNMVARILNINVVQESGMNEESFLEWLGIKRNKNKGAMAEVTYFTCLKMMSETIAKMPWKYYQSTDEGIEEPELTDTARLLKTRPNPFMTPTVFWNAVEMNRNHFGNAYVYVRSRFKRKKYGGEYKVLDLWIMPSNCVQIVVDDAGYFGGAGKIWYVYNDKYSGKQFVFGTDEVLHFNYLDKLKDNDGNYIIQPDVTDKTKELLFGVYPIHVVSNKTLKNTVGDTEEKYPVYMGDLKEAITLFDREKITVELSTEAGDLWAKDLTGIKVRDRFDVQAVDESAVIKGEITVAIAG